MEYLDFYDEYSPEILRKIQKASGLNNRQTWELIGIKKTFYYQCLNNKYSINAKAWRLYLLELHARKQGFDDLLAMVNSLG